MSDQLPARPSLFICGGDSPWYAPSGPPRPRCRAAGHNREMEWRPTLDAYRCPRRDCGVTMPFWVWWLAQPEEWRARRRSKLRPDGKRGLAYSDELVHYWANVSGELPPGSWHYDAYAYRYPETMGEAAELVGAAA